MRTARSAILLAALASAAGGSSMGDVRAEGFSRPAIELRNPEVVAPPETAGTGLAPEAFVQVRVDERGRVAEVDVSRLTPSSEYDDLFVAAIEETLAEWRYAPKLEDGIPVAVDLSWTFQFVPRSSATDWLDEVRDGVGSGAELRRSRVLAMEQRQREEMLRRLVEEQQRHLTAPPVRHETSRFVVITDTDEKRAAGIGANLEALYGILGDRFGDAIALRPERLKIIAVVYGRESSYRAMVSGAELFEWSSGYYHPAGAISFHLEAPSDDALLGLMLHEATHAFMDRHIVAPGTSLPRWLSEGFAEYIGNSKIEKGRLVAGKTRKRRLFVSPAGVGVQRTDAGADVAEVKRALRAGRGLSLGEIFRADSAVFYGEKRRLFYPTAWFLVHFLHHGDRLGSAERFAEFLTYVAEGYPAGPAIEAAYGEPIETMEGDFRTYVLDF